MSELPQTPVNPVFEPPVLPLQEESSKPNRAWWYLGAMAVVVVILLGAVIWRLEMRRNERLAGVAQENILQTESLIPPTGISNTFTIRYDETFASIPSWQNPFQSAPCFVKAENTCQFIFNQPRTNGANIIPIVLSKKQEKQDLFFLFGRMLVAHGGVYSFYRSTLLTGIEPQPYQEFLQDVYDAGLAHGINPAFLFTLYDRVFVAAQDEGFEAESILTAIPPDKLASEIAAHLFGGTPVATKIEITQGLQEMEWSPEAQAVAQALATSLNGNIVASIFAEEFALEQEYYKVFSPSELVGNVAFNFTENVLSTQQAFAEESSDVLPYGYAVCHNHKTHFCKQEGLSATCDPFPFYDYVCTQLTNIP